jgi:hypothetical protein
MGDVASFPDLGIMFRTVALCGVLNELNRAKRLVIAAQAEQAETG